MAINLRVIHGHDFIKLTPDGKLDLEKSKQVLKEVASAAAPLGDYEILIDTRKVEIVMSVTDLWYLAAELNNFRKAFSRKTAIFIHLNDLSTQSSSHSTPETETYKSGHSLLSRMQSNG